MKKTFSNKIKCSASLSLLLSAWFAVSAQAQVAISVGAEEIYDSNIYLENTNNKTTIPADQASSIENIDPYDGDPNNDFITDLYISFSGNIPLTKYLKTSAEGRTGVMIFADTSDNDRITLDSLLNIESTEELLPKPWYSSISSNFDSQSRNVAVADGSTARQSETHTAAFDAGIKNWELSPKWDYSLIYGFQRVDYLGIFNFGGDDGLNEDGADYFSNGAESDLGYKFTDTLKGDFKAGVDYYSFTSTGPNNDSTMSTDELDRIDYDMTVGLTYQATQNLTLLGDVGFNASNYPNRDNTATDEDDSEINLTYSVGANYLIDAASNVTLLFEQTSGTNIDGTKITYRDVTINYQRTLTDRWSLNLGGRFMQYSGGDALSNPTDRYEGTIATNYAITKNVAISGGVNYTNQAAGSDTDLLLNTGDDYEAWRAFIGLSTGLVGSTL